ncbi:hypothetical protein AMATHDRAFT_151394 [Amanita thiersii Skay4041]|uniref:Wax synthase domain-containing protein n=1 Tax=Amanita thiersii Skay4041 TaxID=703135 RepID=A0A2A9NHN0_9AGAR|nr:hypothetical protein AMATHDRAFT_151394 [Amanita thiersii Skay4041]
MGATLHLSFACAHLFFFVALVVKPSPYRGLLFLPVAIFMYKVLMSSWHYSSPIGYTYACASLGQLFAACDYILLTDVQRELTFRKQTKPAYQLPLRQRIEWAANLAASVRGIGWNHEPRHALPSSKPKTARSEFIAQQLQGLAWHLMAYEISTAYTRGNPSFLKNGCSLAAHGFLRCVINITALAAAAVVHIDLPHRLLSIFSVATGLSDPEDCKPLFGSFFDAYSLTNIWGRVWHQLFRRIGISHGRFLAHRVLNLRKGSIASFLVQVYIAFLLSGLMHLAGDYALLGSWSAGGAMEFFLLQAVGITFEISVLTIARRLGFSGQWKWVGYLWVVTWFTLTVPGWADPLFRAGMAEASQDLGILSGLLMKGWVLYRS